ncbi:MAG: hypothetical protein IPM35_05120 [Myxococcales bacterium]|nr:hypothetical protein [Myxococcales bacterium]
MSFRSKPMHAGLLLAGALLLGASSCRELVGVEERASACGGLPFAEASCAACTDQACCAEEATCSEDAKCAAAANAVHACADSDPECRVAAASTAPLGNSALGALGKCTRAKCSLACKACGGLVDRFGAGCDRCIQQACCGVATTCAADSSCAAALTCVHECNDLPDCIRQCLNGPLRNQAVAELQNCLVHPCADACDTGRAWECVDNYSWGTGSTANKLTYAITLVDILTQERVPGVNVELCNALTTDCSVQATSDENGVALATIPLAPSAVFLGYARLTKAGYKTMLATTSKALSKDAAETFAMVTDLQFLGLITQFSVEYQPDKALIFATSLDCRGFNGRGVTVEVEPGDPGIITSYFRAAGVQTKQTTESGTAGFMNVPVNQAYVTIRMLVGDDLVGQAAVPIEAGAITQARIFPRT